MYLTDANHLDEWVAAFSFHLRDLHPLTVVEKLAQEEIYVWDGSYYAIDVCERLDGEESGMVRVGGLINSRLPIFRNPTAYRLSSYLEVRDGIHSAFS